MRISFQFSGGYGGLFASRPLVCQINSDKLPEEQRSRLLELVRSSGILESAHDKGEASTLPRDAFQYEIRIREKDVDRTCRFEDASAPAAVRPLLGFLTELAVKRRAAGSERRAEDVP